MGLIESYRKVDKFVHSNTAEFETIDRLDDYIISTINKNILLIAKKEKMNSIKYSIISSNFWVMCVNCGVICLLFVPLLCSGIDNIFSFRTIVLIFVYIPYLFVLLIIYALFLEIARTKYVKKYDYSNIDDVVQKIKNIYYYSQNISDFADEDDSFDQCTVYYNSLLSKEELQGLYLYDGFDEILNFNTKSIQNDALIYKKKQLALETHIKKERMRRDLYQKKEMLIKNYGNIKIKLANYLKKNKQQLNKSCIVVKERKYDTEKKIKHKEMIKSQKRILEEISQEVVKKIDDSSARVLIESFLEKLFLKAYSFPTVLVIARYMLDDTCYKVDNNALGDLTKLSYLEAINDKFISDFEMLRKLIDSEIKNEILNYIKLKLNALSMSELSIKNDDEVSYVIYRKGICIELINISLNLLNINFIKRFPKLAEEKKNIDEYVEQVVKEPNINFNENLDLLFGYIETLDRGVLLNDYEILLKKSRKIRKKLDEERELQIFKESLLSNRTVTYITLDDIDKMSGIQFENLLKKLFVKMGYNTQITKPTQDQGLDLIIQNRNYNIGVQAKCYTSSNIGNKAIQEVISGSQFYGCTKSLVVTNLYFTKQAIELADKTGVILWDRKKLMSLIESFPIKK